MCHKVAKRVAPRKKRADQGDTQTPTHATHIKLTMFSANDTDAQTAKYTPTHAHNAPNTTTQHQTPQMPVAVRQSRARHTAPEAAHPGRSTAGPGMCHAPSSVPMSYCMQRRVAGTQPLPLEGHTGGVRQIRTRLQQKQPLSRKKLPMMPLLCCNGNGGIVGGIPTAQAPQWTLSPESVAHQGVMYVSLLCTGGDRHVDACRPCIWRGRVSCVGRACAAQPQLSHEVRCAWGLTHSPLPGLEAHGLRSFAAAGWPCAHTAPFLTHRQAVCPPLPQRPGGGLGVCTGAACTQLHAWRGPGVVGCCRVRAA